VDYTRRELTAAASAAADAAAAAAVNTLVIPWQLTASRRARPTAALSPPRIFMMRCSSPTVYYDLCAREMVTVK
jgi:hypothetical protein